MNKDQRTPPPIQVRPGGPGSGGPMQGRMSVQKPKNLKKTILRLLKYIGASRTLLIALLSVMFIATLCTLVSPLLQGKAIDSIEAIQKAEHPTLGEVYKYTENKVEYLKNSQGEILGLAEEFPDLSFRTTLRVHLWREKIISTPGETYGLFFYLICLGIACGGAALFSFFQQRIAANLSQSTVYHMRNDLFRKISSLPIRYTDTHKHGDLMSRMTNDVENVSNAVSQSIASLISALITIVGALIFMLTISPVLTLVAVVTVPLTILVSANLAKFMRKHFVKQQKLLGNLNGQVEEMVTSYKTVVAYGKEEEAIEKFDQTGEELRKCAIHAKVWGSIMGPIMNFLGNMQYVLLASVGGFLFLTYRSLSIGQIQSMLQYSKNLTRPINEVANQYSGILTALAGAERIFEVMDNQPEVDEGKEVLPFSEVKGKISFEGVHFGYVPEHPVLENLNLTVEAGQKIAIVGATGSGKTTIINLLTRFYECDRGEICIDETPITQIPKKDLRKMIGIVLQDTVLFRDSIRNNICYGNENATEEEMRRAAKMSKADLFIDRLPEGYNTQLAEGGSNLSQGQRQLLAITRAIIANPKILILDEATSNVDTRTEMDIQQALLKLMKNRTSLIIAHRLSTIRDADKIIVLRHGRIVEYGDHEELLQKGGEYSKLYQSQFAGIAT